MYLQLAEINGPLPQPCNWNNYVLYFKFKKMERRPTMTFHSLIEKHHYILSNN